MTGSLRKSRRSVLVNDGSSKRNKPNPTVGFVRPLVLDVVEDLLSGYSGRQILFRHEVSKEFVDRVKLSLAGVPVALFRDCRFRLDGLAGLQFRYLVLRFWALTGVRGHDLREMLFEYLELYYPVKMSDMPSVGTLEVWLAGASLERVSEDGARRVFRSVAVESLPDVTF